MEDSYRRYINKLIEMGEIKLINDIVDKDRDVPKILYSNQDTPFLFTRIKNFENTKIVGNICPSPRHLSFALDINQSNLINKINKVLSNLKKPKLILNRGEWVEKDVE
jgi:UbiD family decarboxylase